MNLTKFVWKSNCIDYKIEQPTEQGEETTEKTCPEAPTPECDAARAKLVDVIASACELPLHWLGQVRKDKDGAGEIIEGTETVKPYGVLFSHTKAGTRSAQVLFTKRFRTGKVEKYKTPLVQFDEPSDGETEECGFHEDERATLNSMYEHAVAYVGGVRQQMTMKFVQHGSIPEVEDDKQNPINFNENADPAAVAAAKKKDAEKKTPAKKAAKKKAARKTAKR